MADLSEEMKVPEHVAIIMDGNGRWAKAKGRPRTYGHMIGAKRVEETCENADALGIKYLTVYAFSTENWSRPQDEVDTIMDLIRQYLKGRAEKMNKKNMSFSVIGDRSGFTPDIVELIERTESLTKDNTGLHFCVAMNYGSRDEILRATRRMCEDVKAEIISSADIDDKVFSSYLDTRNYPDPDLLIRTSGEQRLSNYLLWQLAYSEFYFTDICWPDFDKNELIKAIEKYNSRDRRFGGLSKK